MKQETSKTIIGVDSTITEYTAQYKIPTLQRKTFVKSPYQVMVNFWMDLAKFTIIHTMIDWLNNFPEIVWVFFTFKFYKIFIQTQNSSLQPFFCFFLKVIFSQKSSPLVSVQSGHELIALARFCFQVPSYHKQFLGLCRLLGYES